VGVCGFQHVRFPEGVDLHASRELFHASLRKVVASGTHVDGVFNLLAKMVAMFRRGRRLSERVAVG